MDCPQCGAEVPTDDSFCGKCGYAMRDEGPERLDQSRIRVHEEPRPPEPDIATSGPSQQRIRKHTVMGMPTAAPPDGSPKLAPSPPDGPVEPPTEISAARARARARTPQKTMLGIPKPDFVEPPSAADEGATETSREPSGKLETGRFTRPEESEVAGHRARARVRYDSADEPVPVLQRRRKALWGLGVLVVMAAAWLAYRYLTLNG